MSCLSCLFSQMCISVKSCLDFERFSLLWSLFLLYSKTSKPLVVSLVFGCHQDLYFSFIHSLTQPRSHLSNTSSLLPHVVVVVVKEKERYTFIACLSFPSHAMKNPALLHVMQDKRDKECLSLSLLPSSNETGRAISSPEDSTSRVNLYHVLPKKSSRHGKEHNREQIFQQQRKKKHHAV